VIIELDLLGTALAVGMISFVQEKFVQNMVRVAQDVHKEAAIHVS